MNVKQAVCSVNPAANGGTTGSPFSLVEGQRTRLRNPAGGGSWGLVRAREAKRAYADGAWGMNVVV